MAVVTRRATPTGQRRARRRLVWVPAHKGPWPASASWIERTVAHAHLAGIVVGLIVGAAVWLGSGSVTLAVFWLFVAGDAAAALLSARAGNGFARHLLVVVLSVGTALGVLLLTVGAWGRNWLAVVVALAAAGAVRGVAAWLVAPSLILDRVTDEVIEHEQEWLQ